MDSLKLMEKLTARLTKTFADLGSLVQNQMHRINTQEQKANTVNNNVCNCTCQCSKNNKIINNFVETFQASDKQKKTIVAQVKQLFSGNMNKNQRKEQPSISQQKPQNKKQQNLQAEQQILIVRSHSKDSVKPPNKSKSKKHVITSDNNENNQHGIHTNNSNNKNSKDLATSAVQGRNIVRTLKNKPKKAKSALKFYIKQLQDHFKKSEDGQIVVNESEIIEMAQKKWAQMDIQKKGPYINAQGKDKLRYERQMSKYYAGHPQQQERDVMRKKQNAKKKFEQFKQEVKKKKNRSEGAVGSTPNKMGDKLNPSQNNSVNHSITIRSRHAPPIISDGVVANTDTAGANSAMQLAGKSKQKKNEEQSCSEQEEGMDNEAVDQYLDLGLPISNNETSRPKHGFNAKIEQSDNEMQSQGDSLGVDL